MVGVMVITSLRRALLYLVTLTLWQASVNPHLHPRLLDIHRQVWFSLLLGHCPFLLAPGSLAQKGTFVCALQESVFPVLWKFCN